MSPLIETIQIKNGKIPLLEFHQNRFDRSRKYFWPQAPTLFLKDWIQIPTEFQQGLVKCRVTYQDTIELVEFAPYQKRKIHSLKLVWDNFIDYRFKYKDRTPLNALLQQRGTCDDIIIVKNGWITDSTYANLVFDTGSELITPNTNLLDGVQRAYLLKLGTIQEAAVHVDDFTAFKQVHLINAMLGLGECSVPVVSCEL